MSRIEYFFDFLSPYSYFSWQNHKKLPYEFDYRPVTMGALFNHWGIKGPGEIPAKRYYMLKACFRYAQKQEMDFIPPAQHPFNPLYALRIASFACAGELQKSVINVLWKLIWGEGKVLDDPDTIAELLTKNNLPGDKLIENCYTKEAKQEVKNNTKLALESRAFGVPSFVYEKELFWGNDGLEDLITYLQTGDKFDTKLFQERTADIRFS